MAKMAIDYSKWDNLEDSDEENETTKQTPPQQIMGTPPPSMTTHSIGDGNSNPFATQKSQKQTPKGSEAGRHAFQHQGRTIYEWDQSLDEVNLWIKPPPGVTAKHLDIDIKHQHLNVGIKGNSPFLNEDTGGEVIVADSFWSLDPSEGEITINLQKMKKGEMWGSALKGHDELDPLTKEEDKKRIMLERFAEENPGFDFSQAEFNGQIPDARKFMGGVKYS